MPDQKSVLVGISTYRSVESKTVEGLVGMIHYMAVKRPEIPIFTAWRDGFPIAGCKHCYDEVPDGKFEDARNHFAKKAIEFGATHLFMMDSDMGPRDHKLIADLLDHNVDIVAPLFMRRSYPYDLLAARYIPDQNAWKPITVPEAQSGKLIQVDGVGFGCILINMHVLKDMKFPWFAFEAFKDKWLPEDLNFCRKARRAGYKIHVDTRLKLDHIGVHRYRPEEAIAIQEERESYGFRPVNDSSGGDLQSEDRSPDGVH